MPEELLLFEESHSQEDFVEKERDASTALSNHTSTALNNQSASLNNLEVDNKKLYFSIYEVADMFGLNASNLRFWEKEFSSIKPRTNKKGTRFYTQADIENIRLIHYLVRDKGLTLEGARKRLKNNLNEVKRNAEITGRLLAIRKELEEIQREIRE
jgi:DNA-binding transcriptional MerR regulator